MEMEERSQLERYYSERSDEELKQFILSGKDSFQEGAYDMILIEARRRRIDERDLLAQQNAQKALHEMSRGELISLLSEDAPPKGTQLDSLHAEAFRRNIQRDEIAEYRLNTAPKDLEAPQIAERQQVMDCTFPLLTLDTLADVNKYTDVLARAGIPFALQILVNEQDYAKAESETNVVLCNDPSPLI